MSVNTEAYNILLEIAKFRGIHTRVNITYQTTPQGHTTYHAGDPETGMAVTTVDPVSAAKWLLTYQPRQKPKEQINDQIYKNLGKR